jgi:hypothetical protein
MSLQHPEYGAVPVEHVDRTAESMFEPASDRYLCSSLSPCKRTYLRKRIEAEPDV